MRTIDAILYNGEEDILKLRLEILDKYVDEFVICEATTTFRGNPKPLYFNVDRFQEWKDKIHYFVIEDNFSDKEWEFAKSSPNTGGSEIWCREFLQREAILKALTHLEDEDVVYISDCDEIWKPKKIGEKIYKLEQLVYSYYLNNRSSEAWAGTFVGKYKYIKNSCLNHLRASGNFRLNDPATWDLDTLLEDGGWHFTNMGGADEIKRKVESFGHSELDTDEFKRTIKDRIDNNVDYMGFRNFMMWKDETDLPEEILNNKEKWTKLLLL